MASKLSLNESESRYYKLEQIVKLMNDYFQINSDEILQQISKQLQIISLTNDLTIFDPYQKETTEFFIVLNQFMRIIDERSSTTIIWYCIDVLNNICKNPKARNLLITNDQFLPCLGRLLGDHLTLQKRIKLLKLIQDLTCNIQLKWQIPHLTHMIRILVNWIECPDQQIITLSLGCLVNLCYKNLPAINILSGNVDTKRLLRTCTTSNGTIVEFHTCRLLMILDFIDTNSEIITKLVNLTLQIIIDGYRERNTTILRQIIGFFIDNTNRQQLNNILNTNNYEEQFLLIFKLISNDNDSGVKMETNDNDDCISNSSECIAFIFEFFNLIDLKLSIIKQNYKLLIKLAINYLENDLTSIPSLLLLKNISINIDYDERQLLQPLIQILPIFLTNLEPFNQHHQKELVNLEFYKRITCFLQVIKVMLNVDSIKQQILNDITIDRISKIFQQLINDEKIGKISIINQLSIEIVDLYINTLMLINEFVKYDCDWSEFQAGLMQNRQIHIILAQGLLNCKKQTKFLIMEMMNLANFPKEAVCELLENYQLNLSTTTTTIDKKSYQLYHDNSPVLTIQQVQNLDAILNKFKTIINDNKQQQNQLINLTTCDIMELYEYKLITNNYNQRLLENNIEILNDYITKLNHHIIQLKTETNHYHQLLLHSEKSQIDNKKVNENLKKDITNLTNRIESDKGKFKILQQQLNDKAIELYQLQNDYDERIKKLNDNIKKLETEKNQLKHHISKLEDNSNKLEQKLQKKDEQIKQADCTIYKLNMQVKELEESLGLKNGELTSKHQELNEMKRAKKKLLDILAQFATSEDGDETT